jgi:hypothetical protein
VKPPVPYRAFHRWRSDSDDSDSDSLASAASRARSSSLRFFSDLRRKAVIVSASDSGTAWRWPTVSRERRPPSSCSSVSEKRWTVRAYCLSRVMESVVSCSTRATRSCTILSVGSSSAVGRSGPEMVVPPGLSEAGDGSRERQGRRF